MVDAVLIQSFWLRGPDGRNCEMQGKKRATNAYRSYHCATQALVITVCLRTLQ